MRCFLRTLVWVCFDRVFLLKNLQRIQIIRFIEGKSNINWTKLIKWAIQIITQLTLHCSFDLQKSNQQLQAKFSMIRPRNQNKLPEPIENKSKIEKKQRKCKKSLQTEAQEEANHPIIIKPPIIIPPKPKRHLPKVKCEFDPKDQIEEYEDQIITYLKGLQAKYKVNQNYLKYHTSINLKVRNFLVKFIFKMTLKYSCRRSTLYLAVYAMDMYLSKNTNLATSLEGISVAQAALHIAMKYEEIYPPSLKSWTPDLEQIKKILMYEADILKMIDFKLNLPSIYYFEDYFQKKVAETGKFKNPNENFYLEELKINLVSDLCLFEVSLYEFTPYELAKNIRMMVYEIQPTFGEERLILNIKWALERNKEYLDWLKEVKYKELKGN